jgi:hypothetical protein
MVVAFDKCCTMIENLAYAAWIARHHALGSEEIVAISEHTARLAAGLRLAMRRAAFMEVGGFDERHLATPICSIAGMASRLPNHWRTAS